jgi:hypothetical protein
VDEVVAGALPPAPACEPPVAEGEGAAVVEGSSPPAAGILALEGSRVPHLAWISVLHLFWAIESPMFLAVHCSKAFWQMN